jgi:signal transduction histidine kinase
MGGTSFRSRLLTAALLWTVGLFIGGMVVFTALMFRNPSWARVMHGAVWSHAALSMVLTALLLIAGFALVRSSLTTLNRLRTRLSAVHEGSETRITGVYPAEVQPLVDDLNALLEHRERAVRRAVTKAGDLAHGLKTPLAVMSQEADRARATGRAEFADAISAQIERMRKQIEYHLVHARAAASGATPGARCSVQSSAEGLVRTLERLHAGRGLTLTVAVPPGHTVRAQREDLDEMLGNLLDNACKWAASRVAIESSSNDSTVAITVDDDGRGLAVEMRDAVLQRGVRADEAAPGSGFGLAIVRDLAELYGGSIALGESPLGGVRATLILPA